MPIQIIDGFQVNSSLPVDNRITASGSAARDAIPYKYEGLRVFDTSDGLAYVWYNNAWSNENSSGVNGVGTTSDYLPKIVATNVITNSNIYQQPITNNIGINTTTPNFTLEVDGNICVSGFGNSFIGIGIGLTQLSASNITTGNLSLSYLTNGVPGHVLTGGVSSPVYLNPNQLTVGTSSTSNQSVITLDDSSTSERNLFFGDSTTGKLSIKASSNLRYKPSSSQLILAAGTVAAPSISFSGSTNTGIYRPSSTVLAMAISGSERLRLESSAITFGEQVAGYGRIRISTTSTADSPTYTWWGNDKTGISRPSSNVIVISTGAATGVERARFADSGVSLGQGTSVKNMYVGRIRFEKTGSSTGNASVLNGSDFSGSSITLSNTSVNTTTVQTRVNFPTAMSNSNVVVICHIDSTSSNHYPWTVICSDRTSTYINLVCLRTDAGGWTSGSVDGSFVAFCV
jgi:hypothetical protein